VHSVLIRREGLERTGYFDETLSTYEDWDLWLRLSFNFPFIFVPGFIAVYLLSRRGLWHTDEHGKENTGRVIAKALQMLPDQPRYRTARARQALAYGKTWAEILAALRTYPFILRYAWARRWESLWIRKLALRSESPLTSLQELCTEVREATSGARRWRVRQTVAKSWAELASSLAVRPGRQQEAAYAAIHAVVLAPSLLVRSRSISPNHRPRCHRVLRRVSARFACSMNRKSRATRQRWQRHTILGFPRRSSAERHQTAPRSRRSLRDLIRWGWPLI
jgi:hypothetical protein